MGCPVLQSTTTSPVTRATWTEQTWMLFPFFPRNPHRPASPTSPFSSSSTPLAPPLLPCKLAAGLPDAGVDIPLFGLPMSPDPPPPPRIAETDDCAHRAFFRIAEVTVMHSVVTSAIGSIATEIFARGGGGRVGISSSILWGSWWFEVCSVEG